MCEYVILSRLFIIYKLTFSFTGTLCPSNLHWEAAVVSERIGKKMCGRKWREEEGGGGKEVGVWDEEPAWSNWTEKMDAMEALSLCVQT